MCILKIKFVFIVLVMVVLVIVIVQVVIEVVLNMNWDVSVFNDFVDDEGCLFLISENGQVDVVVLGCIYDSCKFCVIYFDCCLCI